MSRWFPLRALACALVLCGCNKYQAQVRVVSQDNQGGVLAVGGDRNESMPAAQRHIQIHCGEYGYTILKQETVPVGPTPDAGSGAVQATELHMQYRCSFGADENPHGDY